MIRYTFLSKWTVLSLTAVAAVMVYLAATQANHFLFGFIAVVVYGFAWLIGVLDSLQEGKWGWAIGMIVLAPLLVGPLLYSFFGPKNTR